MRILLLPFGSLGHLNPFLALGLTLRQRGHEVMVITNSYFEPVVKQAGLDFLSCSRAESYVNIMYHPHAWHPTRGPALIMRYCLEPMPEAFSKIKQLCQPSNTVMAAEPGAFAARIAQESLGIPLATVTTVLPFLRSGYARRLRGIRPAWLRRLGARTRFRFSDLRSDRLLAPEINSFRAQLGLKPVSRVWGHWRHSPQRVIGLWPEWLYGPKPDWPPEAVVTGFIEYDGPSTVETQGQLDHAVNEDAGDRPPIVFTAGSWTVNVRDFFAAACEACEILDWPGLLLTQEEEPLGKPLPRLVRHIRYAPFGKLLPRAGAIVHHGGIGTAARALKAGIPQIIMPMAYDQRYNANRLVRLGVARAIERKHFTAQNLAAQLREMLQSERVSERCRHYAMKLETNTALEKTCDYIEALQ